jgi:hypothetical protein
LCIARLTGTRCSAGVASYCACLSQPLYEDVERRAWGYVGELLLTRRYGIVQTRGVGNDLGQLPPRYVGSRSVVVAGARFPRIAARVP